MERGPRAGQRWRCRSFKPDEADIKGSGSNMEVPVGGLTLVCRRLCLLYPDKRVLSQQGLDRPGLATNKGWSPEEVRK